MKKIKLLVVILMSAYVVYAQDTTKVLFIGNSITYYNNMPQTFEAIANDKGDTTSVTVYAPGGTGFVNHVDDPNVYNKFRQGNWDFVVLQPGSNESPAYSATKEESLQRLKTLKDSIIKYNPCAKILLYEISYGVWGNTQSDLDSYNTTMDLIRSNCEYWVDSTQLFFAPAGESMRTAWNNDQTVMLWGGTGNIHPNAKGSYIIACSFYASIFQKNTLGTSITSSLTPAEATSYQQLADSTVLNNRSDWRINTYNQFTDFEFTVNQQYVDFNSLSQNIDSLVWDFGDGNFSTLDNPNHIYAQEDTYTVVLTTYKGECSESKSKEINTNPLELKGIITPKNITVFPNPASDIISIESRNDKMERVEIYTMNGSLLKDFIINTKQFTYNIHNLNKGLYVLKIYTTKGILTKKIVIE